MARQAQIRARTDADLKQEAEKVLQSLGLTPSAAVNMFYRQIVHRRGIPFEVSLPVSRGHEADPASRTPRLRPSQGRCLTYGDFPRLFWDARPDAALDLDDPTTLARFLTLGDPETVGSLVTLEELGKRLPDLPLRPETRAFWEAVLGAGTPR